VWLKPAWQTQGPEFKPQYCQKEKEREEGEKEGEKEGGREGGRTTQHLWASAISPGQK
jgi:hypothetical protein